MGSPSLNLWDLRREELRPTSVELETGTYLESYLGRSFRSGDIAELFHENTKLNAQMAQRLNETNAQFQTDVLKYHQATFSPDYSGSALIELPTDVDLDGELSEVLLRRRSVREYSESRIDQRDLAKLLRYGCGTSGENQTKHLGVEISQSFRTYPSGGALYPIEIYPIVLNGDDIANGVYYYNAEKNGLRRLYNGDVETKLRDSFLDPVVEWNSSLVLIFTGAFWRSKMKYGPRAYRYVLQESGHIAQNIHLVAQTLGIGSVPLASFYDDNVNDLLKVDGVNEAVVYAMALGSQSQGDK